MSLYLNTLTNEYPRHVGDVQLVKSDFQIGGTLPEGWVEVAYATEYPTAGEDEKVVEVEPTLVDGVLTQTFAIQPLTLEEKEFRDAPKTAKAKLIALGLTENEITALMRGIVR